MSSKLKLYTYAILILGSGIFIGINFISIMAHPYTSLSAAALGWGVGNWRDIKETITAVKLGLF